jgi:hypothetical protein
MKKLILTASFAMLAGIAQAQPAPPDMRAYQAVNGELVQAWTGARAAMLALQDQLAQREAEVKDLKDRLAKMEADKAHAIPDPAK